MGKQNNTPTKVSQEQYTKDLDESVLKLINAGADDEVVKSYMKDYSARYVVEKKNDIASSTSTSTPKESPTQTRVGGTLSVGGKRMITPPSDASGSPKKTPRATKEELSTWDKSFKEKKPKQQTLKEVITPFGQTAIEDIKLSTPSTLEAQREERIIKEANNINKEEVDKLVNDEVNNKQFTDGLREGIKSTVNLVATPIYQYFTDSKEEFLKPYVPLEQELKEVEEAYKNSSIKLTEEQKKQEATKLYREKKEAEIRISNLDRFINNSPKEFRETQSRMKLNELTKRAVMTDRVRQDANYLVSSEDILLNTPKEIEGLNNRVKESLKKGDTITADNLIAEIEDKEKLFLDTAKTVNVIVNRYDENLKDLKDTEAKIDYLKFNYNTEGKLLDDLYSTSLQIIGGGIKLATETAFDTRVNEPAKFIADIGSSMIDSAEKQIVDRRNITIDQVNSPRDLGLWTAQLFTRQAPILASMYFGGQGGLALVSTGSGGQKFREMEKEEEQIFGKKYSFAEKWLASVGYAGLEYALEKVGTFKILNDVKKTVKSFPSAEQALFRSGVKESFDYASQVGKASAREGLTELATSLGQTEIIDIGFLDKEISQRDKINSYSEALTSGIVMGGGMVATTIPVQIMSKLVAETATRAEVQKSRELLEKMNAYAEELKKPDLTDASKKILSEKINDLTQESFDIFSKNKKDLESLSKGEIKAILEINVESQNLRDKAKSVLESNISKEIKDIEISSLQQQYDALQDKKSQIRSGVITDFDLQTNEQIIKLKEQAQIELTKEAKAEGKTEFTFDDKQRTEKAIELYNQKQKQDEREVPKQEGKQPEDSGETISAEVKEDDLQPQEKVVEEGAEPVSDVPLLEKQVEDLRKEEIAEFNKEVENPESFITDGKVDANKVAESDNAKAKEIYAKYDAQIKPLLDNIKTQGKPQAELEIVTEKIEKAARISGVKPKNIKGLYDVNRKMFSQNRVKALASAVVMDRMIGSMAKRANVDKSEIYKKIRFEKSSEDFIPKNALKQGINSLIYELKVSDTNITDLLDVLSPEEIIMYNDFAKKAAELQKKYDKSVTEQDNAFVKSFRENLIKTIDNAIIFWESAYEKKSVLNKDGDLSEVKTNLLNKYKNKIDKLKSSKKVIEEELLSPKDITMSKMGSVLFQVDAWHGSPYFFDKFTTEKMGTGEGAQAFGWGLYFTDIKDIAEYYATTLSRFEPNTGNVWSDAALRNTSSNADAIIYLENKLKFNQGSNKTSIELAIEIVNNYKRTPNRNLYKVNLNKGKEVGEYTWLEWDKPINKTIIDKLPLNLNIKRLLFKFDEQELDKAVRRESKPYTVKNKQLISRDNLEEYYINMGFSGDRLKKLVDNRLKSDAKYFVFILEDSLVSPNETFENKKDAQDYLDSYKLERNEDVFIPTSEKSSVDVREEVKSKFDLFDYNITGEELYKRLIENLTNSDYDRLLEGLAKSGEPSSKAASLFLLENGIDGIKYPAESVSRGATSDTARGFNYVVFDENAVSIEEVIRFQKDANKARGAVMVAMDGQATIYALTDPNVSTPLHEMAHIFEHYLSKSERDAIIKSAGTKGWTIETSEFFARGFEKYLADGVSPIPSLQKLFDKFKEWLLDIYNGIKGSEIDIKLNDKMKSIYDSMITEKIITEEEVKIETTSILNQVADKVIEDSKIKGKTKDSGVRTSRKMASEFILEVKKRLDYDLPNSSIINLFKELEKVSFSKGDVKDVFDKANEVLIKEVNKVYKNQKIAKSVIDKQKALKNLGAGKMGDVLKSGVADISVRMAALNPKVVAQMSDSDIDMFSSVMSRLADNSKVTPVVDLIIAKGDKFKDFYDRYQNKAIEIADKQQNINEKLDEINSLSTNEDIESIKEQIKSIIGELDRSLFQIPSLDVLSDSEIQKRKEEKEEDKKIIRDVYIDLINSEKNGIDVAVSFNGSILNDIISFVEGIDNKLLESLTQTELNNLFNSILNIKQGLGGNKFMNDLMVRKNSEDLSNKTIKTSKEISKPSFKNKVLSINEYLRAIRRSIDPSISSKGVKGLVDAGQRKTNLLFENLPTEFDNLLMNEGISLYETTGLDMLAKSDGVFVSMTKKFNDDIDDVFSDLIKESKNINQSQLKILYHGLNKMAMSNRLDGNIGNIAQRLKYTADNTKNSIVSKEINDFLKYLESVKVDSTIEVVRNQRSGIDIIVNIDAVEGVDVVITTSQATYKVPKNAKTFTIQGAPIDAVNNLTVENANFLVGNESKAFDIMSKYLKEGSKYALEAMMLHNGSYFPMRNNYFPMMSSKSDGSITSDIMDTAGITYNTISTKSGNLLELKKGNKLLNVNPFSSVKTSVNSVALQHSKRNTVNTANKSNSLTESFFVRERNQGVTDSKEAMIVAVALKNIVEATIAVDLGSTYAKISGAAGKIAEAAESLFVQGALISTPNRSIDLQVNILNAIAAKPSVVTVGISNQKKLKKLLDGRDASLVYANMKASDVDGLVYSDISSVSGANMRRRGLSGYNKLDMNSSFENMMNKQLNLILNNPASNFLAKVKTGIISTADVITKPSLFLAEFADSFEKASGKKFEIEKFVEGDPKWLFDNRVAINSASTKANQLLNKITTSSNPYSAVPRSSVQSTSNISFGVNREGKSPVETNKKLLANISDKATGLFARFIRTNTSRIFSGGRKIFMQDKRREGFLDVVSGVSVLSAYGTLIAYLTGYLGGLFATTKLGMDEEDEKLKEDITNSLDNARENPELMSLLNKYNKIISDPEVSVEDREAILTELINNDNFKMVSAHVTTQHILRSFGLMSMSKAINNEGLTKSVDYNNPNLELFSSYYAYLLTEEAEKSGINTKKERDKVLSVLSTFLFNEFGSYYDNPSLTEGYQRFAMAEITAGHIMKYKTFRERLYINAIAKPARQLFRAEAGAYGSVPIDLLMGKINKAFTEEVLDKPYDYFSQNSELFDAAYLNDMLKDDEQGKKKRSYQSAYLYVLEQAFPKSSSQFKNIVGNDFNDDTETLINFLDYLYVLAIPGATDIKRIESAANRDEVFKIMNVQGDKITFDALKIKEVPKDLKEKQEREIKEKVKTPLKTGKQVKKKFGGN